MTAPMIWIQTDDIHEILPQALKGSQTTVPFYLVTS